MSPPSDLSTPQKILRDSLKSKLPLPPSPPQFAPPPAPSAATATTAPDEAERRRMERIRLGRESLERRRRRQQEHDASESFGNSLSLSALDHHHRLDDTDVDGDVDMDTPPSSACHSVAVKKAVVAKHKSKSKNGGRNRKGGGGDDDAEYVPPPREGGGDDDDDDDGDDAQPRRTDRKFTKAAIQRENELEKKKRQQQKDQEELRSRFIEGSMRDRASAPPPRDIVGDAYGGGGRGRGVGGGGDGRDGDDYYAGYLPLPTTPANAAQEGSDKEQKKKKHGFTFGLGNLFRFNPFALVDEARAAYIRQKALHEKKEELKRQKREAEQLYLEMKARGEFRATFVDGDGTDHPNTAGGSARKRKLGEISSFGSDAPHYVHPYPDRHAGASNGGGAEADYIEEDTEVDEPEEAEEEEDEEGEGEGGEEEEEEGEDVAAADEMVRSVRYEDTTIPPYRAAPAKGPEEKPKGVRRLVKRTSDVFANALTPASPSTPSVPASPATAPAKPLTKREIQRQERLLKKVSNLEEQLEKARRELEAVARGAAAPPVPALPSAMPPPPHPTPVSRSSQDTRANGMPPPPAPAPPAAAAATVKTKGTPTDEPETPAHKMPAALSVVINKMLPDTPDGPGNGSGNRYAPGVMSPAADVDDDTTMDEDFSIIPLSPVLNSSSIGNDNKQQQQQQQQPGALAASRVRRNGARARSKSPGGGLAGLRRVSGAKLRRVSSVLSSAANGAPAAGAGDGKPEKKKLKKSNSWLLSGPGEGGEQVPRIPKLPPSGAQ